MQRVSAHIAAHSFELGIVRRLRLLEHGMTFGGFLGKHRSLVLCVIATAIVAAPLGFIRFAPLHDYPSHLARMSILHDLVHGGGLSRYYEIGLFLIPNIGMDVIVLALLQVLPVETAAALFIVLTLFVTISGADYLHRSLHDADDVTPFLAAALTYNSIFTLGFLNYLFGVGLMLWSVGWFIRLRERDPGTRFAWGCLAALGLVLAHVAAFGVYAIVVAGLELQANWGDVWRRPHKAVARLFMSALPLFLVVGFFYAVSPTSGETGSPISFGSASFLEYLRQKISLASQTVSGHENLQLDAANTALIGVFVVVAFAFAKLRLARQSYLASGMLCLAFVVAPGALLSGLYLDARLPIAIAFVLAGFAGCAFVERRVRLAVLSTVIGLLVTRSVVLAQDWSRYDNVGQTFVEAFHCLPKGSILFGARPALSLLQSFWQPPIKHFLSYASVTDEVFVPSVFAHPSQQPIRLRPDLQDIYDFQTTGLVEVKDPAAFEAFVNGVRGVMERGSRDVKAEFADKTYVILLEPRNVGDPRPAGASIIADRELFAIYRLDDGSGGLMSSVPCPESSHDY